MKSSLGVSISLLCISLIHLYSPCAHTNAQTPTAISNEVWVLMGWNDKGYVVPPAVFPSKTTWDAETGAFPLNIASGARISSQVLRQKYAINSPIQLGHIGIEKATLPESATTPVTNVQ